MPPKKQKKKPSAKKKQGKKAKGELKDEHLDAVAGGIDTVPLPEKPAVFAKKKITSLRRDI